MTDQSPDEARRVLDDMDNADITRHGFTPYMRDYEIVAGVLDENYSMHDWRWLFTHCVVAEVSTAFTPDNYVASWDDERIASTRDELFERGFVWAIGWASAADGALLIEDSVDAAEWSTRLGYRMHEVRIETNVYNLRLIFHGVSAARYRQPEADR